MPSNTQNGNALTGSTEAAAKKKKTAARAPRKTATRSTSAKSAAPKTASSTAEILFTDLPNPLQPAQPPYIWIDHPLQAERLLGPVYNIRMGVGGADAVEICIDGGVWQSCRFTSGYWWYDWAAIQPGRHTLSARMRTTDGRWYRTPPRACEFRP